jgi:uncharacterized protein
MEKQSMDYKSITCSEIKSEKRKDNLYLSGYAAYFSNIDSYKDSIQPGAFAAFLQSEEAKRLHLCYQHDFDDVIGTIEDIREDEKGLYFEAKISNTSLGRDVATLIEDGALTELSIGYSCRKSLNESNGVRLLTEIYLYEISIVTRAANDKAVVMDTERKEDLLINKEKVMEEQKMEVVNNDFTMQEMKKAVEEKNAALEKKLNEQNDCIDNLDASIKEMSEKVMNLIEKKKYERTFDEQFKSFMEGKDYKDALDKMQKGERQRVQFEIKLDTSALTGDVNRTINNTTIYADAQKNLVLFGRIPSIPVAEGKNKILFTEGSFTDNTGYVTEGNAVATANTASATENYRELAKIGSKLPFTRETATDVAYLLNWAKNEGLKAIQNKVDAELISGEGADTDSTTKKKIYGIIGQGSTAFNASTAGMANAIENADFVNLIDAIDAQINIGTNGAYVANVIFIHPADFGKLKNVKDKSGRFLFDQNGGVYTFVGKRVVVTSKLSAGQLLVAAEEAFDLYEKQAIEIEIERVASTDSYVMYERWRGQLVVPSNKKKAVIYVANISSAIAAITGASSNLVMSDVNVTAIGDTTASLGWTAVAGADGYKYSTDNINWSSKQTGLSLSLTGLSASTAYTYYVKAVKTGLVDSVSKSATFTTKES